MDKAEKMYLQSLKIYTKLGQQEGIANQYGNLGNIQIIKGNLQTAQDMCVKSLGIYKKLNIAEGKARQYLNLGNIFKTKGEISKAIEMMNKSLEIATSKGFISIIKTVNQNLNQIKE
jgi:tetratricopeptide (TPR) repeat protein